MPFAVSVSVLEDPCAFLSSFLLVVADVDTSRCAAAATATAAADVAGTDFADPASPVAALDVSRTKQQLRNSCRCCCADGDGVSHHRPLLAILLPTLLVELLLRP